MAPRFLLLSHNIHTCQAGALQSKPPAAAAFAALSFAVTATTFIHALQPAAASDSILCPPVSVYVLYGVAPPLHIMTHTLMMPNVSAA